MMQKIDILNLASGLAAYAGRRQGVIAENVAQADTPGYQARDLTPFTDTFAARQAAEGDGGFAPFVGRATRSGHEFPSAESVAGVEAEESFITAVGAASPNGNTVSLEDQMARAAETKMNHDLALGVWRATLGILRSAANGGR
ncbi:MAG: flagellar basal-body rod protein FlgB [Paracoccaceae bacterium]|jgi:flagellar basal-body rod protein FlgB